MKTHCVMVPRRGPGKGFRSVACYSSKLKATAHARRLKRLGTWCLVKAKETR